MKSAPRKSLAFATVAFAILALPFASFAGDGGADVFKSKCAMCHGSDGAGKTMMGRKLKIPDLQSTEVQKKSDADLRTIIAKGKDKMPEYGTKLSKVQINKLVAYIRDLAKKH